VIHWLAYWTGLTNGSGPRYLWWSGIGSDIGELALLGGLLSIARHSNCHAKRCWRFGKPVDGTPYRACHRHHPAHDGTKRNVPLETITDAHRDAR
jgi:hypothetical protein